MQDAILSLLKIALQMDPSRSDSVIDEFETILSTIMTEKKDPTKESAKEPVELSNKENTMSEFMQQNITEQFMGRSPSLIIHSVPYEQPRYVPHVKPVSQINPFTEFKYAFTDPSDEDVHSLSSIESMHTHRINIGEPSKEFNFSGDELMSSKDLCLLDSKSSEVLVVKAPTEIFVAKVDDTELETESPEDDDADEVDEADENEFEEFPLKDGIHYKDPATDIVYKEKEGINRVGVFNPDTNKFKRDTK